MKDVDYRNHVDPSISSGSSPGEILVVAPHLRRSPSADNRSPFPIPNWHGEARPHGVRRVRLQTRYPSLGFLTYLVKNLGYDGSAALAATVQAHQPWLRSVDRRRANPIDADEQAGAVSNEYTLIPGLYRPAAPSRRTKTGGGLNKKQVHQALARKRWDSPMKKAAFEIVYGRRSTLQVSNSSGIPVEILYVYASRLRHDIRGADLHGQKKAP
jgi:hypothetical protein